MLQLKQLKNVQRFQKSGKSVKDKIARILQAKNLSENGNLEGKAEHVKVAFASEESAS